MQHMTAQLLYLLAEHRAADPEHKVCLPAPPAAKFVIQLLSHCRYVRPNSVVAHREPYALLVAKMPELDVHVTAYLVMNNASAVAAQPVSGHTQLDLLQF